MIKFALGLALLVMAFTVPLGKRTFAGHIRAIWKSSEGKDLREGVNTKVTELKKDSKSSHSTPPEKPGSTMTRSIDDISEWQRPLVVPAVKKSWKKTRRPRRRANRTMANGR
ncbi:hypothetical protein KKF84_05760 [Myxococcota bacterium]|nr:hypothetical protein [Myxococcota bacterium]